MGLVGVILPIHDNDGHPLDSCYYHPGMALFKETRVIKGLTDGHSRLVLTADKGMGMVVKA